MRVVALVFAVIMVAGGCTAQPGAPVPAPAKPAAAPASTHLATTTTRPPVPKRITAKYAFGDYTTMDACSVVPLAKLPAKDHRYGEPQAYTAYAIDDCQVEITVAAHRLVEVTWGQLQTTGAISAPDADHEDVGAGLILKRTPADPSGCTYYLEFPDRIAMTVEAYPEDKATTDQLCGSAHDVVTTMVAALRSGTVATHNTVRTSSLLHEDACALLPQGLAGSIAGPVHPVGTYPTHHLCFYASTSGTTSVDLSFGREHSDLASVTGATMTTVAGRRTARVQQTFGDGTSGCKFVTAYGHAVDTQYTSGMVESVELTATRRGSAPCAATEKVAAKVWAKLPKD